MEIKQINIITAMILIFSSCTHGGYNDVRDVAQWVSLEDGERDEYYYRIEGSIYGTTENNCSCAIKYNSPLEVDVATFLIAKGNDYAKDKNQVYFPISLRTVDFLPGFEDCDDATYITRYVVQNADSKSFKYLGDGYAIDKHHMYKNGERIPWDDSVIEKVRLVQTAQTECQ